MMSRSTSLGSKWKSMLQGRKLLLTVMVVAMTELALVSISAISYVFSPLRLNHSLVPNTTTNHDSPCPQKSRNLVGPFQAKVVPLKDMARHFPALEPGGTWRPAHCAPRQRVAIVVPYRDRPHHLPVLLSTLHTMLPRQLLHYRIFVVEQADSRPFNKGLLINIGFVESLKIFNTECFIFHDIDLIPQDDRNLYMCVDKPRHMSVKIDIFNYICPYPQLFGGVFSIIKEQFLTVNGFSNLFWGWGCEDDDFYLRLQNAGIIFTRDPDNFTQYKMLKHAKRKKNLVNNKLKNIFKLSRTVRKLRFKEDGLTSLRYNLTEIKFHHAYTHIVVELTSHP